MGVLYWVLVLLGGVWFVIHWRKWWREFRRNEHEYDNYLNAPTWRGNLPGVRVKVLRELGSWVKWIGGAVLIWAVLLSWPVRLATWVAGEWYGGLFSNRTDATVQGYMRTQDETCSSSCWGALVAEEDPLHRFKKRPVEFVEFTIPGRIDYKFALDRFNYKKSNGYVIPPQKLETLMLDAYHERNYPELTKSNGFTFQGPGIYRVQLDNIPYSQCAKLQAERRNLDRHFRERSGFGISSALEQRSAEEDMASLLANTNVNYEPIIELAKRGQCPVIRKVDKPRSRYIEGGWNSRVLYEDWFHSVYRVEQTRGVDLETSDALYHSIQYCVSGTLLLFGGLAPNYCFRSAPKPDTPIDSDGPPHPITLFRLRFDFKTK